MTVLLVLLLACAVGGAACVVWAERGGPRWVRIVARVTLGIGAMVGGAGKSRRRGLNRGGGNSGDGDE
ncbi:MULTISPECIES: hypothetical protein [unclassified Streptomyces]|uniref:hypothetical protein n=1 Tax=unclassified Streptomyces TaxID=2593676 RepID=UPI00214AE307|nr:MULTISPECIES: hypothetical protein [unclassified Streptomyces]MCX5608196.1 hypothetical protein [Streptomyces sp. NBC_00047]UUU42240.1 hypothetical protein JIW86_27565 [Streptomyces sp. NBC_00162]